MGRAARPLHDPGNHRAIERGSNLQAARRGGLIKPAKPAEERENTAALTPSLGARPRFGRSTWLPLCFDRTLKCSLSRLKNSQFLPNRSNLLADIMQFIMGLFT